MSKYSKIFEQYPHWENMELAGKGTFHRKIGDIPGCTPAVDIFIERELSQVQYYNLQSIPAYAAAIRDEGPWPQPLKFFKNPAPKNMMPWDPYFDVKAVPGYLKNKVY